MFSQEEAQKIRDVYQQSGSIAETARQTGLCLNFYPRSFDAGLHAVLDGTFAEDDCKSRQKRHAQNLVIFRHLVCGILRKHEDKKWMTISMKRTHCRNNLEYRVDVLNQAFQMAA